MTNTPYTKRIESIDLLRGIIMIIMAIDHVREYSNHDSMLFDPTDLHKTYAMLFFTRWITHFCAPLFVFLSGISAFLSGRSKPKKELSLFLLKRGLWLIFLEMTVIDFAWMANPRFSFIPLGVLWALGISMICLAALIFLPKKSIVSNVDRFLTLSPLADREHPLQPLTLSATTPRKGGSAKAACRTRPTTRSGRL